MHPDHIGLRHRDELGETAITPHDTEGDGILAYMSHAPPTVAAVSAGDMPFGGDAVAYLEVPHTGTAVRHDTHKLMPHRVRGLAVSLGPCIPFIHMQIRAADSSFGNFDENIVHSHFRHRYIFHPDTGFGVFFY